MANLSFVVLVLVFFAFNGSTAVFKSGDFKSSKSVMLLDFSAGLPSVPKFYSVNDDVMGGVSTGQIAWDSKQEAAVFYGTTLADNNGGFSSVKSRQWSGFANDGDGLKLVVKGDGRTYKISVDVSSDFYSYSHDFETVAGKWIEVYLPYSDFIPSWRGFIIKGEPSLSTRPQDINQLGIFSTKFSMDGKTIGSFVPGPFKLCIKRIEIYQQ